MDIDPKLVLIQAIPFLVCLFALTFLVWKPLLALLARREAHIDGFRKAAQEMEKRSEARVAELEARMVEVRAKVGAERARLRTEAAEAEAQILDAARRRAELHLQEARAQLAAERRDAEAGLRKLSEQLAIEAAGRVLGRSVTE